MLPTPDLRWRIVWQRIGMKRSLRAIAESLIVSLGIAFNVIKRFESTGKVEPKRRKYFGSIVDSSRVLLLCLISHKDSTKLYDSTGKRSSLRLFVVSGLKDVLPTPDLRWRIVWQRIGMKRSLRAIAESLIVSLGIAFNVIKRFESTGKVEPKRRKYFGSIVDSSRVLLLCLISHKDSTKIYDSTGKRSSLRLFVVYCTLYCINMALHKSNTLHYKEVTNLVVLS